MTDKGASSTRGRVLVGTSGWLYPSWRGDFYPRGLPHTRELAYLAARLPTVEVNGTFYSLTRPSACDAWRRQVPPGFVFAIKGSRYITHMLKLRGFEHALANFFASGILRLGPTLGPILWQLPPQLPFDPARARAFFEALPRDMAGAERWARRHDARTTGRAAYRGGRRQRPLVHALEIRHPSWLSAAALALLRAHESRWSPPTPPAAIRSASRTAGFAYVRLHGSTELYASRYHNRDLERWSRLIDGWASGGADVYVYFDNDARGHAPHDAERLRRMLEPPIEAAPRRTFSEDARI